MITELSLTKSQILPLDLIVVVRPLLAPDKSKIMFKPKLNSFSISWMLLHFGFTLLSS